MADMKIELELPWPPTVNTYWRKNKNGMYISKRGKEYQKMVYYLTHGYHNSFVNNERLKILINAYPPDKRKRDLDNILKSLFDALAKAHVFNDDEQIDEIHIIRCPKKIGIVIVQVISI